MAVDRTKALETAQRHLAKGQYDRAIGEYRKIVEDDPKDVRTWLKIGDLYTRKGARKEACDTYQRVANQYAEQGFFLKAVAVFKQILKLDAGRLDALERLAEMYEQLQLVSDALATYEQIAQTYAKQGDGAKALSLLGRMADLDATNVPVRIKHAEALSKAGQVEEAAKAFEASALLLKEQGRIDDYVKVAERMLYHRSENVDVARDLAEIYLQRNDPKRALSKLQICFKANAQDLATLELLANAFYMLGQTPKTVSVFREMARIHQESGNTEERMRVLARILELEPHDREAREALAELERAPRARPEEPSLQVVDSGEDELEEADEALLESAESSEEGREPEDEVFVVEGDEDGAAAGAGADGHHEAATADVSAALGSAEGATVGREAQIARLLTECDVFLRYGLKAKVVTQLHRVLELDPTRVEARERLKDLYLDAGDTEAALEQLYSIVDLLEEKDATAAARYSAQIDALRRPREPSPAAAAAPTMHLSTTGEPERPAGAPDRGVGAPPGVAAPPGVEDDGLLAPMSPEEFEAAPLGEAAAEPEASAEPPGEIDEVLDEVEFFLAQGMASEATSTLRDALDSFPDHPLLLDKLAELEGGMGADAGAEADGAAGAGDGAGAATATQSGLALADDISEELDPLRAATEGSGVLDVEAVFAQFKKGVEETIGLEDTETHYDLGIAYREMGLLDDAIHEFELCVPNPQRECLAHTMIGLCYADKGELADAISHFKKGLYADVKTEQEELGLYFELGAAYEAMHDAKEALYYLQKVQKRDPGFRDVAARIQSLATPTAAGATDPEVAAPRTSEVDSAFDELLKDRE